MLFLFDPSWNMQVGKSTLDFFFKVGNGRVDDEENGPVLCFLLLTCPGEETIGYQMLAVGVW